MRNPPKLDLSSIDKPARDALLAVQIYLQEIGAAIKRLGEGDKATAVPTPVPGGEGGVSDHGDLTGLSDDDHSQYLLLAGRSGQTVTGAGLLITGTGASDVLVIRKASAASGATMLIEDFSGNDHIRFQTDTSGPKVRVYSASGGDTIMDFVSNTSFNATAPWARWRWLTAPNRLTLEVGDEFTLARPASILGGSTHLPVNLTGALLQTNGTSDDSVGLRLRQSAGSPTANFAEFQSVSPTTLAVITPDGYFSSRQFWLNGSTSGTCKVVPAATTTNHTLTLPANNARGTLGNDGAGALSWGPTKVDLTAQTGSIGSTTMLTGAAGTAGMYRLSFYLKTTTAGNALDVVKATVQWNDGTAQTLDVPLIGSALGTTHDLATINAFSQGSVVVNAAASQNITFTTTVTLTGSPQYELHARLEPI